MTNEEKARDIVFGWAENVQNEAYDAAIEMAEYKDSLLREELDKAIEMANKYHDQNLNRYRLANHIGAIAVLSKLLGEEFPYDRLHMNFATMD